MSYPTEADIENLLIEQFQNLGYAYFSDVITSSDSFHLNGNRTFQGFTLFNG